MECGPAGQGVPAGIRPGIVLSLLNRPSFGGQVGRAEPRRRATAVAKHLPGCIIFEEDWYLERVGIDAAPCGLADLVREIRSEDPKEIEAMISQVREPSPNGQQPGRVGYVVRLSRASCPTPPPIYVAWREHHAPCIKGQRAVSYHSDETGDALCAAFNALYEEIAISAYHLSVCEACAPILAAE